MSSNRDDGLPTPTTIAEMYLAAILDEVRGAHPKPLHPVSNRDPHGTLRVKEGEKTPPDTGADQA